MYSEIIKQLSDTRKAKKLELDLMLRSAETRGGMNREEAKKWDALADEVRQYNERIDELTEADAREQAAVAGHIKTNDNRSKSGWSVTGEPAVYQDPNLYPESPSFFKDLYRSGNEGNWEAAQRLQRSQLDRPKIEVRALGNTGGVGGSGGEMAPPEWLVDEFVALARPARVTANLLNSQTLTSGVSSINIPKVATGTTTALQSTQNTALSQTDMTTNSVSSVIDTIGGKQVVAQQLVDQSAIPFDRLILGDMAADYAKKLNVQVLTSPGTGNTYRGLTAGVGVGTTTFTSATPKVIDTATAANSFYFALIRAINAVQTTGSCLRRPW